jgi:lipid A disaccharide synthetase
VTPLMVLESKLVGFKEEYISQPNILLGKMAVPELIREKGTPETLREHLNLLLKEGDERRQQIFSFMEIDNVLGPPDAITKTAELALQLLGHNSEPKELAHTGG